MDDLEALIRLQFEGTDARRTGLPREAVPRPSRIELEETPSLDPEAGPRAWLFGWEIEDHFS